MKIDLYYDPVRPETLVSINDQPVVLSDIYGFLFPVREYMMQTWLPESGSWDGISKELNGLIRDESSHIVFHGREIDYRDFAGAVRGLNGLCSAFQAVDYVSIWKQRIADAESLWKAIVEKPVVVEREDEDVTRAFRQLFPEQYEAVITAANAGPGDWLIRIQTAEDLPRSLETGTCCLINGDDLLTYENYSFLDRLTGSLRRSYDMLVCAFSTEEKKNEFSAYNEMYKKRNVVLTLTDEESWKERLREKYGVPFEYRQRIQRLRLIYQEIRCCIENADRETDEDGGQTLNPAEIRKQLQERHKKRWAANQNGNIQRLEALLFGTDYMCG